MSRVSLLLVRDDPADEDLSIGCRLVLLVLFLAAFLAGAVVSDLFLLR